MDPSLNLIFGDHALASFDSTYSQPIDIYEIELGITILFSFVYALFFFTFSSVSSFFFFGVLGIMFRLAILIGLFLRELRLVQWVQLCLLPLLLSHLFY